MRDGDPIDRTALALNADTLARLAERDPDAHARLGRVELFRIAYASGGLKVTGYVARPKQPPGPLPCVIYNRGGYGSSGVISARQAAVQLSAIADRGYLVAASQYRGNASSEGLDEFGGADLDDVLALVPLLEREPGADPSRIGLWGWSRGGLMAYLALARTDRFAAAVILSGLTDLGDYLQRRPEMEERVFAKLVPDYRANREAAILRRSPIRWPEKLCKTTPILMLHGGADWRVHPSQALRMATALYEARHPFRFAFFEGADHGLAEVSAEATRMSYDWLDRYLRDRLPWPSLEPHGL
jgi:dipeptidyl aminopeptidase/acylaminoacyl peptidase